MVGPQPKLLIVTCALLVLISAGLATALSVQFSSELTWQFNQRVEQYARTFADQVQDHITVFLEKIPQGPPADVDPRDLDEQAARRLEALAELKAGLQTLVDARVGVDAIYAQVAYLGEILAERRSYTVDQAQLEFAPLQNAVVMAQHTLASGYPYVDVRRTLRKALEPVDSNSYVRLGFSQLPLQVDLLSRLLQTILWTFAAVALGIGMLIVVFLFWSPRAASASAGAARPAQDFAAAPGLPVFPATSSRNGLIQSGGLVIDDHAKSVRLDDRPIVLSPREYELLKLLAAHAGRIFSNEEIIKQVWSDDQFAMPQDVKKYVYLLRKKLEEDPKNPKRLLTVRGFGYKLANEPSLTSFDSS